MNRQASIHITELQLTEILQKYNFVGYKPSLISRFVCNYAKGISLNHRAIPITNDKLKRDTNKITASLKINANLFSQTLLLLRRKEKHKGLQLITPNHKDWLQLKEVCNLATEFCNEYNLDLKDGYKKYISIGLLKAKNFNLLKLKTLHSAIYNYFESEQVIIKDKNKDLTEEAHNIFLKIVSDRIGYFSGYKDNFEKYQYFCKAKDKAIELGVSIKAYITSQFIYIDFTNQIPDPIQLVGEKAIERLQKYCFEHKIKIGENKEQKVNFKKLKSLK